mmetsp:Transcript_3861/g.8703  ORF Transcript_3861/g.8703 Transcript_3861/m.8703 type:complete len:307 (-) Transcript_3861:138-1058(-)
MQWLSSVAEAATSAVSTIQQTIEAEKNEFIEEYNTVRSDVPPSKSAASSTAGASSTEGGTDSALQNLRRVGWAMLNPLEDQDSLTAEVVGPSVVMLPWEAPGLSEPVRVRMRALSQEPAVFLSPPQAEDTFDFKMESSLSLVVEALSVDKHLEKQRHLLVPKQVSEYDFFRNYFAHLHALAQGTLSVSFESGSESGSTSQFSIVSKPTSEPASETFEVAASASFSATPLEDQFECVANACLSEEGIARAMASKVGSRRDGSPLANDSRSSSPGAVEVTPYGAVDATVEADSWEEELRAELAAMEEK